MVSAPSRAAAATGRVTVGVDVRLEVRTVAVDEPGPLVALLPETGPLAWVRDGEGIVGWGVAARLEVRGPDRFAAAEAWWDALSSRSTASDEVELAGTGMVAFGSFAFDDAGSSTLIVPAVLVGHRGGRWWVTTARVSGGRSVAGRHALQAVSAPRAPGTVRYSDGALPSVVWEQRVAEAVSRIVAGDLDKVVLARDLVARLDAPLDPRWPLARLAERYTDCWTFSVDGLLGATPELLVRLESGRVASRVLAGTTQRGADAGADEQLAAALLGSAKDRAEHAYAVRSVARSLAERCSDVTVPTTPSVLRLPNVQHLASDLTGVPAQGVTSLGLVAALHPSAAVCGAPTPVALEAIRELEAMDRGRYAGPVGWLGAGGDGEWGLALRCAEVDPADPARLRLFAGCGIVAGSEPAAELAESAAKLVPMRDALAG